MSAERGKAQMPNCSSTAMLAQNSPFKQNITTSQKALVEFFYKINKDAAESEMQFFTET